MFQPKLHSRGNVVSFMKNPPERLPELTPRLPVEDINEIKKMGTLRLHSYIFRRDAFRPVIQRDITLLDESTWGYHSLPFTTKWPDSIAGTDIPAIAKAMTVPCDVIHEIDALIKVGSLVPDIVNSLLTRCILLIRLDN